MAEINSAVLNWLLEEDNPGLRYLALRDLCDLPHDDPELIRAKEIAHKGGPIAKILDVMHPEGYWLKKRAGYAPKFTGTIWSVLILSQLGASLDMDNRIARAGNYLFERSMAENGQFGTQGTASTTIDCLQGNMCAALTDLGVEDQRLDKAFDWLARSNTGEGIAPTETNDAILHYEKYKIGPNFLCGANNGKACAWGAIKVMLALAKVPELKRTAVMNQAIQRGVDFLLSVDPATAEYPTRVDPKPNLTWWKFGFPGLYIADVLHILEVFSELNMLDNPRLKNALDLVRSKQDSKGRWPLEISYKDKIWIDTGELNQPNKWVTFRALKVLKKAI